MSTLTKSIDFSLPYKVKDIGLADLGRKRIMLADARILQCLSAEALDRLLDPQNYLGEAAAFVDRVLAVHRQRKA